MVTERRHLCSRRCRTRNDRSVRRWAGQVLLLACLALGYAGSAGAQDVEDLKTTRDSLAALTQFPAEVTRYTDKVRLSFTPGSVNQQCDYACWGSWCYQTHYALSFGPSTFNIQAKYKCWGDWCYHAGYAHNFDFSSMQNAFNAKIKAQQDDLRASAYSIRWEMVSWAKHAGADDAAFAELDRSIKAIEADPTETRKRDIQPQLSVLADKLAASRGRVQALTQQLARFLILVNGLKGTVDQAKGDMERESNGVYREMDTFLANLPCGQNEVKGRFRSQSAASLTAVDNVAGEVASSARAADREGSVVLGTLQTFASRYQGVSSQIANARNAIEANSVISATRIRIVNTLWRQFLAYVGEKFPPGQVVKGTDVRWVACSSGAQPGGRGSTFYVTDSGRWREHSPDAKFDFVERARDEWSVYLFDAGRKLTLQLDLHTKLVTVTQDKSPPGTLCRIDGSLV